MFIYKKTMLRRCAMTGLAAISLWIAGCENAGTGGMTAGAPAASPVLTAVPEVNLVSVFTGGIPEYDGSGREFEVGGEYVKTDYSTHLTLPLGIFKPVNMERYALEGGTAWGPADKLNYLAILPGAGAAEEEGELVRDSASSMAQYKEYRGTVRDIEGTVDVFTFEVKGEAYRAKIRTTPDQQDRLQPVFVSMLGELQYMEKKPPIEPGIFFKLPPNGGDKDRSQIYKEILTALQAIVDHDHDRLKTTMYSEGAAEYLGHFADNIAEYRFTEMSVGRDPAGDRKTAIVYVGYTRMDKEGYIDERSVGIALIRNKQGLFKIADID
ncbi:hypothetical protein [Paenibacillus sp. NFR01]|uniref:hypothetical protein n=1 Tax=Paenibacillus sp. NFR01 TaxID=1566279 RepID=UPI0008D26282|nr:hypothetical protein [Paenibacillus sp. NFR01]SET30965.1 hypothetical protein SAMN03159358_1294 [Paenibacillus sp. NFR01]